MANEKTYPNYLMHYRTKGSKNGISTTPGYNAVGQKAKGHWVNGHYVYYEDEAKSRAFQQGLAEARGRNSAYENQAMVNRMENAPKAKGKTAYKNNTPKIETKGHWVNGRYIWETKPSSLDKPNNIGIGKQIVEERIKKAQEAQFEAANPKVEKAGFGESRQPHYRAVNQHNAEVAGRNAAREYQKAHKQRLIDEANRSYDINQAKSARESAQNQHNRERAGREAALKQQQKASLRNAFAKGAQNNWQQKANKTAGKGLTYDKVTESGIHYDSDLGTNRWRGSMSQKQKDARKALASKTKAAKAESQLRNSRSDIGNAMADAREDAKRLWKSLTSKAKKKFKK